jgi:hypothetical protein
MALALLPLALPLSLPCLIVAEAYRLSPVLSARQIVGDPVLSPVRLLGLVQVLPAAAPLVVHLLLGTAYRALHQDCHIAPLNCPRVSGLTLCMKNDDPFGFTPLHFLAAMVFLGVAGIAVSRLSG